MFHEKLVQCSKGLHMDRTALPWGESQKNCCYVQTTRKSFQSSCIKSSFDASRRRALLKPNDLCQTSLSYTLHNLLYSSHTHIQKGKKKKESIFPPMVLITCLFLYNSRLFGLHILIYLGFFGAENKPIVLAFSEPDRFEGESSQDTSKKEEEEAQIGRVEFIFKLFTELSQWNSGMSALNMTAQGCHVKKTETNCQIICDKSKRYKRSPVTKEETPPLHLQQIQ